MTLKVEVHYKKEKWILNKLIFKKTITKCIMVLNFLSSMHNLRKHNNSMRIPLFYYETLYLV